MKSRCRAARWAVRCFVCAFAAMAPVLAGDLDPPGSPAPTPGPEPRIAINAENTPGDAEAVYRITSRGSYYLEREIRLGPSDARHGIAIEASDVTIDLNGFTMDGYHLAVIPLGLQVADSLTGIVADPGLENVAIRNGTIRDWGRSGIGLVGVDGVTVDSVRVLNCDAMGLRAGHRCLVQSSQFVGNDQSGVSVGRHSTILDSLAEGNEVYGIAFEGPTIVRGCVAVENGWGGIREVVDRGSLVEGCVSRMNGFDGISIQGSTAINNVCSENGGGGGFDYAGITVNGDDARVEGNHVAENEIGIEISTTNAPTAVVVRNVSQSNTVANYTGLTGVGAGPIQTPNTATSPWANISINEP